MREKLIEIYLDTKEVCKNIKAPVSNKYIGSDVIVDIANFPKKTCNIIVEPLDTVSCLIKYSNKKTAILNNASSKRRGGGVEKGSVAQEECLFRCSNLFQIPIEMYPIKYDEFIYTEDATFVKDFKYSIIENIEVDVITLPAINLNMSHIDNPEPIDMKEYEKLCKAKMEYMFLSALKRGCGNIILAAWGCGVFKNDPNKIATMFKEVTLKYQYLFDNIVFGVINDKNSVDNNYEVFKKAFQNIV